MPQAAGPVLRIRKSRAPPTILDDVGPFGHTREIERPAPAPRSVADSTSVIAGRPLDGRLKDIAFSVGITDEQWFAIKGG